MAYDNRGYSAPCLPDGYLIGGYYTDPEKEKLKKEYIVAYPRQIADALERDGKREANKRTQIRKYYEYLLRVRDKLNLKDGDFEAIEADLAELFPKATYAQTRQVVSGLFVDFIRENLEAVQDARDLRAFVKHFEAVIAFMKKG